MPSFEAPISVEEMLAEIERLKSSQASALTLALTCEQERVLIAAAPGTKGGLKWDAFLDLWRAQGWEGSEDTLRKNYRRLVRPKAPPEVTVLCEPA